MENAHHASSTSNRMKFFIIPIVGIFTTVVHLLMTGCIKPLTGRLSQETDKTDTIFIFGHRGDSLEYPENTVSSVRSALGKVDGAEIDIQLTSDGKVVVLHDDTLQRTAASGQNLDSRLLTSGINTLNWNQIKDIKVGPQDRLPSLTDILDLFKQRDFIDKRLLIEVKSYGTGNIKVQKEMVQALTDIFNSAEYKDLLPRMHFISFDKKILSMLQQPASLGNSIKASMIVKADAIANPDDWPKLLDEISSFSGIDLESNINLLVKNADGKTFIQMAKEQNKKVITWINRVNRTDGYLFKHISKMSGADIFTSDLNLSVWNGKLTQKRVQEVRDLYHIGSAVEAASPLIDGGLDGKTIIYSPVGDTYSNLDSMDSALSKDFENIFSMSDVKRVIFQVGDLEPQELGRVGVFIEKNKELAKKVKLVGWSDIPVSSVRSAEVYEQRSKIDSKLFELCNN
ncbi:MAG: hypothetical protein HQK54_13145 [Oligoflexales bacterium]|nr:hypothetical protein [Oligoflexales bacterium]